MLLVAGVLFLLADKGVWNFWGLSWYTVLFIVIGVVAVASSTCADCMGCCKKPEEKPKKK